jgi:hypothetical protein
MTTDEPSHPGTGSRPRPLLTGHDLIRHGLATPGPQLAVILQQVYEAQLAGESAPEKRRCGGQPAGRLRTELVTP